MRDLTDPRWITLKGIMFLCLGAFAAGLILLEAPSLRMAFLLGVTVWAFCRTYYFAFYVIERYIDPSFRFSGLGSAVRYIVRARGKRRAP